MNDDKYVNIPDDVKPELHWIVRTKPKAGHYSIGTIVEVYNHDMVEVEFATFHNGLESTEINCASTINKNELQYYPLNQISKKENLLMFLDACIKLSGLRFQDETVSELREKHKKELIEIKSMVKGI